MLLDIIVPHYNETWEIGRKLFSMLDLQRGVDFDEFRVLIVNDGQAYHIDEGHFADSPYMVEQIDIPHGGVSAARNAGIENAKAEWIMFCDFDDMFTNVYALRSVLEVLPAPQYDLLWTPFIAEDRTPDGEMWLHLRDDQNAVFTHGKVWRRSFLLENELKFDTEINFSEDSEFCAIADVVIDHSRVGRIDPIMPAYMWCYRENSVTTTPGRYIESRLNMFHRHKKLCEAFKKHLPHDRYCGQIARTIIDAYHVLNRPNLPPALQEYKREIRDFYIAHKSEFWEVDAVTMREIKRISRLENVDNHFTSDVLRDLANPKGGIDETISVTKWLKRLEEEEV